ncbi:uncharacterized protein LOC116943931 [Petromyzon marinus]|uniref:Uncharacterized protein LOC116943931 isoform X2 n=1 Tax=Petromyzon marinus TaxID=7757 RepID=A0AAJ7WWX4_PETMA|nr:uncharacterized protein LOC116943931 isoform X2 [Petromyzon marinus]
MESIDAQRQNRLSKIPHKYHNSSGSENYDDEGEKPNKKMRVAAMSAEAIQCCSVVALPLPPEFITHPALAEFCSQTSASTSKDRLYMIRTPSPLGQTSTGSSRAGSYSIEDRISKGHTHTPQRHDLNYKSQVLLKLDIIIENQAEQLHLLQTLANRAVVNETLEDVLPNPFNTTDELEELCCRISTDDKFKKDMISYLSSLGGCNVGDSVHRMMRTLGTNALWSKYSLKGRKGKLSLIYLPVFMVLTRACLKNHPRANVKEIEGEIAETLKHAPNKRGGANYKESAVRTLRNKYQSSLPTSFSDTDL